MIRINLMPTSEATNGSSLFMGGSTEGIPYKRLLVILGILMTLCVGTFIIGSYGGKTIKTVVVASAENNQSQESSTNTYILMIIGLYMAGGLVRLGGYYADQALQKAELAAKAKFEVAKKLAETVCDEPPKKSLFLRFTESSMMEARRKFLTLKHGCSTRVKKERGIVLKTVAEGIKTFVQVTILGLIVLVLGFVLCLLIGTPLGIIVLGYLGAFLVMLAGMMLIYLGADTIHWSFHGEHLIGSERWADRK